MNEFQLREQIRERIARGTVPITPEMRDYMTCEGCGSGLEWQYIGGQGDWKQRILCEYCGRMRFGVPHRRVIVPLVALQYGISELDAINKERRIEEDWLRTLANSDL